MLPQTHPISPQWLPTVLSSLLETWSAERQSSQDPERSFWERFGLRLAGFRGVEWAVKPIYYVRTGIWLSREETNTQAPISQLGTRPILFISGEKDEICPAQNARIMFNMG